MFQFAKIQTSPPPVSSPLEGEGKGGGDRNAHIIDEITWTFHPARHSPIKTVVSLAIVIFFLVLIQTFYDAFWVVLGFLFLFASLNSFFLPTVYVLDQNSVTIKKLYYTNRRQFKEFRRYYSGKNGILLSPFAKRTFLNNFRGLFLYFPPEGDLRNKIIDFVKQKYPEPSTPEPEAKA